MAPRMLLEQSTFQRASSDLFASASLLPLLCLKEKRSRIKPNAILFTCCFIFFKIIVKIITGGYDTDLPLERVVHKSDKSGGAEQCVHIWFSVPGSPKI